jgi:hypothetical protein
MLGARFLPLHPHVMAAVQDYVTQIRAVSWTLGAIIVCMSAARLWVRFKILNQPNWDDLCNVLATVCYPQILLSFNFKTAKRKYQAFAITCTALATVGTYYGLGRSMASIPDPKHLSEAIKYTLILTDVFLVSIIFGKLSALIFLVRLMGLAAPRWQIVTVWIVCGIMVILNAVGVAITIGFCYPAAKQWDQSIEGSCMSPQFRYGMSPLRTISLSA